MGGKPVSRAQHGGEWCRCRDDKRGTNMIGYRRDDRVGNGVQGYCKRDTTDTGTGTDTEIPRESRRRSGQCSGGARRDRRIKARVSVCLQESNGWNICNIMAIHNNNSALKAEGGGAGAEHAGEEFQAPRKAELNKFKSSVFLAGTIEQNTASRWQQKVVAVLEDLPVAMLNPRRDDWDPSWKQRASNPEFNEQVTWEMDGLRDVDVVALYFEKGTISPICLLELGLLAAKRPQHVVVCCPDGYWRIGNVEMVARRFGICMVDTFEEMVAEVRKRLEDKIRQGDKSQMVEEKGACSHVRAVSACV